MAIVFAHGGGPGTGWYRMEQPARWLQAHGTEAVVVLSRDRIERDVMARCSTFVMQRASGADARAQVLRLRERGIKCVYEIDDDLWSLPEWNAARTEYTPEVLARMTDIINACDTVTVSTEPLKARVEAESGHGDVRVVPNGIPVDLVPNAPQRTRPGIRVGWFGSNTHAGDLAIIEPVLRRLLAEAPEVTLVFMGGRPSGTWPGDRVELHGGVAPAAYYKALRDLELDVLVAPLAENTFNRAKSAVKVMEGGALGLAIIASGVGPYRALEGGVNGLKVRGNDEDVWLSYLRDVVGSWRLRLSLGATARAWVGREHSMDATGPLWASALL